MKSFFQKIEINIDNSLEYLFYHFRKNNYSYFKIYRELYKRNIKGTLHYYEYQGTENPKYNFSPFWTKDGKDIEITIEETEYGNYYYILDITESDYKNAW